MGNDKKNGEQEKSFVVKDKRFSATKEEKAAPQAKEEEKPERPPKQDTSAQQAPLPEIDFTHFILSLSTSALIQLGEVQDPMTQSSDKNLPVAKQTIDLISMLKDKTKGNLSPEEEKVVEYILYDLRIRYVKAAG
ncbi:MAG TPA: DUF1844 domain-containing protein [Thermodesulfobacteriota bacterium]|nr:DUF1844 domain-containing protein [Thermodesulfobacteriota bacterium]